MDEERIIYRRVGKEIWQGTQVFWSCQEGWLRRPDFELIRICESPEEAEMMLKELNRTKWVHRLAKVMGVE